LSVVLPSEATLETQPEHENSIGPDFMITSDSDDENEQTNQWFRPGFLNQPVSSSSTSVIESIHDLPLTSNQISVVEQTITNLPCSSNQVCPLTITTNVSPPPTILLDSTILQEVCENIFKDLNMSMKTINNLIHKESYFDQWTSLRERIDYVMNELHKSSLEAHNQALSTLQDWFKDVVKSMEEVNIKRNQKFNKIYLSDIPIYMDATSIISSSVHSEDPGVKWVTKLLIQSDAPILEKLKKDSEQEKTIKELKKELLEQRLLTAKHQRKLISQQEEAKAREEALAKELKESMDKQAEKSNNMMQEMLELMKKQANH